MGAMCIKQDNRSQHSVQEIDFQDLFKKQLIGPNGDFFQLLNFLNKRDVACLTYLVKALFHRELKEKVFDFVLSFSDKIENLKPPAQLIKQIKQKNHKPKRRDFITKSIPHITYNNGESHKDVDEIFSISSCPRENYKQDYYLGEGKIDLRKKQLQIQEKLQKLSEALKCAEKAYEVQRSCFDRQSQAHQSFMSKFSHKSPYKTMTNIIDTNDYMYATSFHSGTPKNQSVSKKSLQDGTITLKKAHTKKQPENQKAYEMQCKSNSSKRQFYQKDQGFQPEENLVVDRYLAIKKFYEHEIAKYREEREILRNRLVISEKQNQSSGTNSNVFTSLLSKQSQSSVNNRKRTQTMKLCSAQVNQQIVQEITQTIEYGTKMTEVHQSDAQSDKNSQSNDSVRRHAKSMIIRLFRDSKMFPIEYSKKSSPVRFIEMRQKIQDLFKVYYSQKVYLRNPIERTNMIFLFEDRQPKRYYDYLKDYKTWILIGKVNQNLHIGAFISLKQGPKTSTMQSFLFSLPKSGKPYILKAKNNIMDPMIKPEYINFGDSEFRIKSGTKKVNLSLENINMNFQEEDGSEPNTRKFSSQHGQNIDLQQLEIHQIIFSSDCS